MECFLLLADRQAYYRLLLAVKKKPPEMTLFTTGMWEEYRHAVSDSLAAGGERSAMHPSLMS